MVKCKKHPKYKGVKSPRKTKKHPKGCPGCWQVYMNKSSQACKCPRCEDASSDRVETIGLGSLQI